MRKSGQAISGDLYIPMGETRDINATGAGFGIENVGETKSSLTMALQPNLILIFSVSKKDLLSAPEGFKVGYAEIHGMSCKRILAIRWAPFRCSVSRISCDGLELQVLHSTHNASCLFSALHSVFASIHPI